MSRLLLCIFIALTACSTIRPQVITQGDRYSASTASDNDYKLGVGDKIRLTVYKQEALSGEFQVSPTGALGVPLIGDVQASGLTTAELGKIIRTRLADGYLIDPRVNIEMLGYRPYFVLGEVRTPGQYSYSTGLTALSAIASAGGFTPRAEKRTIYIRQPGSNDEKTYRLLPNLVIRPGDTIRLGERLF